METSVAAAADEVDICYWQFSSAHLKFGFNFFIKDVLKSIIKVFTSESYIHVINVEPLRSFKLIKETKYA